MSSFGIFLVFLRMVVGMACGAYVVRRNLSRARSRVSVMGGLDEGKESDDLVVHARSDQEQRSRAMKVKELIEELKDLDQDAEVILQEDAEGNGYRVLRGAAVALYYPYDGWHGECYDTDDPSAPRGAEPVVVLHPIN